MPSFIRCLGTPAIFDSKASLEDCIIVRTKTGVNGISKDNIVIFSINFANKKLTLPNGTEIFLNPKLATRCDGIQTSANDLDELKRIRSWFSQVSRQRPEIHMALIMLPADLPTNASKPGVPAPLRRIDNANVEKKNEKLVDIEHRTVAVTTAVAAASC